MHSSPIQMLFNEVADIAQFDLVNSRTCPMKFKDFQAPALFSSTFKALKLREKKFKYFRVLSRMHGNPVNATNEIVAADAVADNNSNSSSANIFDVTSHTH